MLPVSPGDARLTATSGAPLTGSRKSSAAYRQLLDESVYERWTLARLVAVTGWSRSHLDRVFWREMGMSVREYVARAAITRAADLIEAGEKIESAMLTLGYRNKTSFYQLFRRYAGVGLGEAWQRRRATPVAD